ITSGTKTVEDHDGVKVGDSVTWTIRGDIPKVELIDAYRIVDELDSRLELVTSGADAPTVALTGNSGVVLDSADYTWTNTSDRLQLDFTESGREKLAEAWQADPAAQVEVVLNTV